MFADHSPEFVRFANRYGKTFESNRSAFDTLIAPNLFYCGQVLSRLPLRLPPGVPLPLVEYSFIEVKDFPQGIVSKEGDINCAALYHTYPLCLLEFYGILASNPAVLSFIGDPTLETSRNFYLGGNPAGFQHWANDFRRITSWEDLVPAFLPKGDARCDLAFYMMHIALRFLWFHELGHILDGHVEYLIEQKGYAEIYFHMRGKREQIVDDLEARSLEVIADTVASQLLLKGIFDHEDSFMPEPVKALDLTDRLLVNLTAITALCWFMFAREAQVAIERGSKGSLFEWTSHPSAIGRLSRIIGNLHRFTERRSDLADQSPLDAFKKLKAESEAMARMDQSMEFLRVVQAHDVAEGVFNTPFLQPLTVYQRITDILKRYSYIYRFCDGEISAANH
ncbi:MAG: hypothetical protein WB608_19620 [Terracidiphilus sp.]